MAGGENGGNIPGKHFKPLSADPSTYFAIYITWTHKGHNNAQEGKMAGKWH